MCGFTLTVEEAPAPMGVVPSRAADADSALLGHLFLLLLDLHEDLPAGKDAHRAGELGDHHRYRFGDGSDPSRRQMTTPQPLWQHTTRPRGFEIPAHCFNDPVCPNDEDAIEGSEFLGRE
jgi:hypothetical protein